MWLLLCETHTEKKYMTKNHAEKKFLLQHIFIQYGLNTIYHFEKLFSIVKNVKSYARPTLHHAG